MKSKPNPIRTLIREYISDLKGERKENLREYITFLESKISKLEHQLDEHEDSY
jgi:hypothetical protein